MIYVYDGTFFGFLSAVFDAWHDGLAQTEDIHVQGDGSLFAEREILTDEGKAGRILTALKKQCGERVCHFLYYGFMADMPQREMPLLQYIQLAFRYKGECCHHLSEKPIWRVRQWARKTGNERHKLLGLIRFRELEDGMLYSRINPSCHVVPLMAPHFARRLARERWVIHDVCRHSGVYYDGRELMLVDIPKTLEHVDVSAEEETFNRLWRRYYQTIAIPERRNERLRRQYMPKKYWPYLTEVQNEENL